MNLNNEYLISSRKVRTFSRLTCRETSCRRLSTLLEYHTKFEAPCLLKLIFLEAHNDDFRGEVGEHPTIKGSVSPTCFLSHPSTPLIAHLWAS